MDILDSVELFFCPYCGAVLTKSELEKNNLNFCYYCDSNKEYKKATHNFSYYLDKELLHGKKFDEILLEEENVTKNPLWDTNCERKKLILSGRQIDNTLKESRDRNKPKCPTCQSTKIKKISALNRGASIAIFGLFSSKINKQFECENCGYKW